MTPANRWTTLLCATAALAACTSTPPQSALSQPTVVVPATQAAAPSAAVRATATATASMAPEYLDPHSRIRIDSSIYFDFDDFSIRPDQRPTVALQGKYLASHEDVKVKVEGNSDERGGSEYNLALGQKRAEAAVKALRILGVHEAQMEAVSWGEERPKAAGHDESSWSQNRRVDITYPVR